MVFDRGLSMCALANGLHCCARRFGPLGQDRQAEPDRMEDTSRSTRAAPRHQRDRLREDGELAQDSWRAERRSSQRLSRDCDLATARCVQSSVDCARGELETSRTSTWRVSVQQTSRDVLAERDERPQA